MKSSEIRSAFLGYFERHGHAVVASSSLIPGNDATLLFTNAGMVQFKDVFLGEDQRPYRRAVSSQRCVRAGGKHNDLENVGYTARHHTFFEMLGNFSFGDYFKRDAIRFAWEFLTGELKLPAEKLWITVHISDDEAADIWIKEIGIDPARFSRLDEDNFWQMGDTGPCGPSSEIFFDHGEEIFGGPPGSPNDDGDRYIEIWNLVFMQFERQLDGSLKPLPNPSIDTGMGLERIAAVMQGVHNNYDIDLFQGLIRDAAALCGSEDRANQSLRVIADHIRSCAFLVLDGVVPGNEGRGYVLRRIIRRALRHGNKLGVTQPFFHALVASLAREMGAAYPDIVTQQQRIAEVLRQEEEQFARTLAKGLSILDDAVAGLSGTQIPGPVIFKLYDTYGFPTDLTNDIARERGLTLDMEGYELAMQEQRERARAASQFGTDYTGRLDLEGETQFAGYTEINGSGKILALLSNGNRVELLAQGSDGTVVLDSTAFYAESGGQVGDRGTLEVEGALFEVHDCTKQGGLHLHHGKLVKGTLRVGQQAVTQVDSVARSATALNHSATHLLHAALRKVLGPHIAQKGSLVDADRLRFDFSHPQAITAAQLKQIEDLVNAQIRLNSPVETELMDIETARKSGAMMLFGEKYGSQVRVLRMGQGFSVELCGGTHATRTGDIGLLKITSEAGVAAGVRRIEAVTGAGALQRVAALEAQLDELAQALKTDRLGLVRKAENLLTQNRQLGRQVEELQRRLAGGSGGDMAAKAQQVSGVKVLAEIVEGVDAKALRDLVDQLRSRLGDCVVVLASVNEGKIALVCGVAPALVARLPAGEILAGVAALIGGKAGGRGDLAQGGGTDLEQLPMALATVAQSVAARLG